MFSILIATFLAVGPSASAQDAGVGTELERASTSTPQEMKAYAQTATASIKESAGSVDKMTEQARKETDASTLECLTPRNVSMQALVQVSESASTNMDTALDASDRERADHELRKLSVSLKKSDGILAEAQNCTGSSANKGNENIVVVPGAGNDDDIEDNDEINEMDVGYDPPDLGREDVSPFQE